MAKYRSNLPQMSEDIFLTDGGMETTLVFHQGINLPEFAAFVLMQNSQGRATLVDYFQKYISIAKKYNIDRYGTCCSVSEHANRYWVYSRNRR